MIIYEVTTTKQADADLRSIYEYIAFELLSPENAAGQLERLEQSILGLDIMPERHREYEEEPWKSRGLRVLPVDNYLVFYVPDETTKLVTVIRVMYSGRNINEQLRYHTKLS